MGLSRYVLDDLLLQRAVHSGATLVREGGAPDLVAHGRHTATSRTDRRLLGFKAHHTGPSNDAVELYFFRGGYVGVNPVENGITNVCGLLPEGELVPSGFDIDEVVRGFTPLRERLAPLTRGMAWMKVGPLVFEQHWDRRDAYYCGDALSFVDPFTGSGMLGALLTGALAGRAAALGTPVDEYLAQCRRAISRPFEFSSLFRAALRSGWAERLAPFVPGQLLYRLTRPTSV